MTTRKSKKDPKGLRPGGDGTAEDTDQVSTDPGSDHESQVETLKEELAQARETHRQAMDIATHGWHTRVVEDTNRHQQEMYDLEERYKLEAARKAQEMKEERERRYAEFDRLRAERDEQAQLVERLREQLVKEATERQAAKGPAGDRAAGSAVNAAKELRQQRRTTHDGEAVNGADGARGHGGGGARNYTFSWDKERQDKERDEIRARMRREAREQEDALRRDQEMAEELEREEREAREMEEAEREEERDGPPNVAEEYRRELDMRGQEFRERQLRREQDQLRREQELEARARREEIRDERQEARDNYNKAINVSKLKIPWLVDGRSFALWAKALRAKRERFMMTDDEALDLALSNIKDEAMDVLKRVDFAGDFEGVMSQIELLMCPERQEAYAMGEITTIEQGEMTLLNYKTKVEDIVLLRYKDAPGEAALSGVDTFLRGLRNQDLRRKLVKRRPRDIKECYQQAIAIVTNKGWDLNGMPKSAAPAALPPAKDEKGTTVSVAQVKNCVNSRFNNSDSVLKDLSNQLNTGFNKISDDMNLFREDLGKVKQDCEENKKSWKNIKKEQEKGNRFSQGGWNYGTQPPQRRQFFQRRYPPNHFRNNNNNNNNNNANNGNNQQNANAANAERTAGKNAADPNTTQLPVAATGAQNPGKLIQAIKTVSDFASERDVPTLQEEIDVAAAIENPTAEEEEYQWDVACQFLQHGMPLLPEPESN